jgi:hypothetical protein
MTAYFRFSLVLLASAFFAHADQIELQNGDHFSGTVMSITPEIVVLQSDALGQIKLPRAKVSTISLGSTVAAPRSIIAVSNNNSANPLATQPTVGKNAPLQELGANTNLVQQIRKQFLADAGPQANEKFDDLLSGLMTGKMDMNGLRAEAKSAADQIRALKKDMGADAGQTLDAYLSVLDNFLAQSASAPATPPSTNAPKGTIIIR